MNYQEYNGWHNYETWCVQLWIDNDQGSQRYWMNMAQAVFNRAEADQHFTKSERALLTFMDSLKNGVEAANPIAEANMWADMMGAALSEVNWREIADAILENNCKDAGYEPLRADERATAERNEAVREAAPELLAALGMASAILFEHVFAHDNTYLAAQQQISAALAKAKGAQ